MAEIIKKPNEITDNELDNVSGGTSDEKSYALSQIITDYLYQKEAPTIKLKLPFLI